MDVPHEDAGVPVVVASREIVLGGDEVGLLLEGFHLIYLVYSRGGGSSDVTVTSFGATWLDANGNDGVLIGSIAQCLAQYSLILRGINDQGIGWCHHDVGIGVLLLYLPAGVSDAGGGVACLGFGEDIVNGHVRDLLFDNADVFLVGDHPHVLDRTDWLQSIYCQLNEGTSHAHHINELLWVIGG